MEELRKSLISNYILTLIPTFLFLIIFHWWVGVYPLYYIYYLSIVLLIVIYIWIIIRKLSYDSIIIIKNYFLPFFIIIYLFILFGKNDFYVLYMYYVPSLIVIHFFLSFKNMVYWSAAISASILLTPLLNNVIPFDFRITQLKDTSRIILQSYIVISTLFYTVFVLYFVDKKNKLEKIESIITDKMPLKLERQDVLSKMEKEKYKELYERMLFYIKTEKPYQNPEFSINDLAQHLNSNITYISTILNTELKMNFKSLINEYRISQVKEDLKEGLHEKYTLKYVYNRAGFKYQSTFNRVFKELENVTPTEYIINLKDNT